MNDFESIKNNILKQVEDIIEKAFEGCNTIEMHNTATHHVRTRIARGIKEMRETKYFLKEEVDVIENAIYERVGNRISNEHEAIISKIRENWVF